MIYTSAAVVVDPRGLFSVGKFPVVTWDSRRQKMDLFVAFNDTKPVECIVLGSSRAMKTSPPQVQQLASLRSFNFCVDSARSEDYLAIYRWVASQSSRLRLILIGLDVEALHSDDVFDQRLTATPQLMWALADSVEVGPCRYLGDLGRVAATVLSVPYTLDMIKSVRLSVSKIQPRNQLDDDGNLHYVAWEQERLAGSYDIEAKIEASREEYRRRFAGMTALSAGRKKTLRRLLREATQDGVRVAIWITPIHPTVANYLSVETNYATLLADVRSLTRQLGEEFHIHTFDFSDPANFSATADGWYDGGHLDEANQALITEKVVTAVTDDAV